MNEDRQLGKILPSDLPHRSAETSTLRLSLANFQHILLYSYTAKFKLQDLPMSACDMGCIYE